MFGEDNHCSFCLFPSLPLSESTRHLEKLSDLFEKLRVILCRGGAVDAYGVPLMRMGCILLGRMALLLTRRLSTHFCQKVEARVASDQELKLTELLRYYMRDIQAAKVRAVFVAGGCVPTWWTSAESEHSASDFSY